MGGLQLLFVKFLDSNFLLNLLRQFKLNGMNKLQQIYRFNHDYKKFRGLSYRVKCLQSWILANPRAAINSVIVIATLIIFSSVIIFVSKKHAHSYATNDNPQIIATNNTATQPQNNTVINTSPTVAVPTTLTPTPSSNVIATSTNNSLLSIKNVTVRNKDNLSKVFKRFGLDPKLAKTILALSNANSLRNLHAGQKFTLSLAPNQQLAGITFPISATDTLIISKDNDRFQAKVDHIEPVARLEYAALTIKGSIYSSAKKAGISSKVIAQLVSIFSDKVNLNKTLRSGDKIAFLYKDYYIKDQKINKNVNILAAEYIHAGKISKIVAFTDPKGITNYYTPDGLSLKSPFVRYPLKFKRIGSPFSLRRFNPILHAYYEHTGVDLDADAGTPIKASSDGVIASIGMVGDGYGNKIIIKHGQYSTVYAHMRGFASGVHHGSFVHQGQLIGYVGMTGRATGPHLHYEFRINGVPHDPLKVKLPSGELIAKAYRGQFFAQEKKLFAQLDLYTKSLFAANTEVNNINS